MKDLGQYLDLIVEPTFDDFHQNPQSLRHCFFACVAIYHSIDRAAETKGGRRNLRKDWGRRSLEFTIVDMVAHHFKHVRSDKERRDSNDTELYLSDAIFRKEGAGVQTLGDDGVEIRNLYFVIRDAIKFLRGELASRR